MEALLDGDGYMLKPDRFDFDELTDKIDKFNKDLTDLYQSIFDLQRCREEKSIIGFLLVGSKKEI